MRERKAPEQGVAAGYRYVSLGLTFAGGIVLFMGAGYALDRWLGTLPWLMLLGTIVGAVLSFLSVYRRLQADEERERRERVRR